MKYVNIQNGVVVDACRVDPATIYPASYAEQFVDAPDDVDRGWLFDGTAFTPPAPEPVQPLSATKWKLRKALNALGLRTMVEQAVADSADQDLKDAWEFSDVYLSNDPLALSLGGALGKTEAEIYAVFELANSYAN